MKNFKKIASAIAALSLAACMVAPVATMTSFAAEHSITITAGSDNSSTATHSYVAYQVFKGTLTGSGTKESPYVLANPDWGDGVDGAKALTEIQKITEFKDCTDAASVVKELGKYADESAQAKAFAKALTAEGVLKSTGKNSAEGNVISGLDDGYYLVMDENEPKAEDGTAKPNSSAMTRYILKVLGKDENIQAKVAAPTVDKQVWDNDTGTATDQTVNPAATAGDGGFWGETADHAINEKFNFKLTATLPISTEFDEYKTYKLVFHDSMSKGVTYDGIKSVVIKKGANSITIPLKDESKAGYEVVPTAYADSPEEKNATLTVTIEDLKAFLNEDITSISGVTVEVVYEAHLSAEADVQKTYNNTTTNANAVYLEYSNNPNVSGEGESGSTGRTPEDNVWVFTYEVDSKKTAGDKALSDNALPGAEFQLKKGGADGTIIKFIDNGDGTYTVADQSADITSAEEKESASPLIVDTVVSAADGGKFNFIGLDAGTYTLVETKAPDGYNLAADVTITVTATHKEDGDETNSGTLVINQDETAIVDSDHESGGTLEIVDEKGATLPSTGGIGTTLFYLGGGALVAVAGVMLITKKRMTKE